MSRLFGTAKETKGAYEPLRQNLSDEDEQSSDEEIFKQNGGALELKLLPSKEQLKSNSRPRRKQRKHKQPTQQDVEIRGQAYCRTICVLFSLFAVSLIGLLIGVFLVKHTGPASQNLNTSIIKGGNSEEIKGENQTIGSGVIKHPEKQTDHWEKPLDGIGSESCVRLVDIDEDGALDIIFGAATEEALNSIGKLKGGALKDFCNEKGEPYPCIGKIVALKGTNGDELWRLNVRSLVFLLNCEDFDIDRDGKKDCIGTGRVGVVVAFNPYKGKVIWDLEDETGFIVPNWNTFQVQALPDWDQDGVPEVLVPNGGDPAAKATNHHRKAARLIVLSGATGKPLGERYLEMPDSRETYMSPVIYMSQERGHVILLGDGGETVPGDLMGISLVSFCHYIFGEKATSYCPPKENNPLWHDVNMERDEKGLFTIHRDLVKGVMVPPVIVDVNKDGVDDLVVSSYGGSVFLMDGKDLSIKWMTNFTGMESYSSPAPGYFDDDDVLDFMVHWSIGAWPTYNDSYVYILSGKDGSTLWKLQTAYYQMSSDLVLQTTETHRDLFIFRVKGRESPYRYGDEGVILNKDQVNQKNAKSHQEGDLRGGMDNKISKRHRRHGGEEEHRLLTPPPGMEDVDMSMLVKEDYLSHHLSCDDDLTSTTGEIFLLDKRNVSSAIRLAKRNMMKFKYTLKPEQDCNLGPKEMCVVLNTDDRTTGAVGDVDGDGTLDYVGIAQLSGSIVTSCYSYAKTKFFTKIAKINLEPRDRKTLEVIGLNVTTKIDIEKFSKLRPLDEIEILPLSKQKWSQYLGRHGDSIYHDN